jgi:hypothetical protein
MFNGMFTYCVWLMKSSPEYQKGLMSKQEMGYEAGKVLRVSLGSPIQSIVRETILSPP